MLDAINVTLRLIARYVAELWRAESEGKRNI